MIPRLAPGGGLHPDYRDLLEELRVRGFEGDIQTDYATRLVTATDNSVYQVVPQAVIFPRHAADVALALALAHEPRFRRLKLSPRGGGTGTNGQSLCDGVIVDVSRHMRSILEVDVEAGTVTVEPGVILDQLNAELKPHGVFFAPNLSPSNRATIGGMIATDACGKGSRIYGKTSNHLVELDLVLLDGTRWTSRELTLEELAAIKQRDDLVGAIHREVDDIVTRNRERIASDLPKLKRFLTGYDLAHVYSEDRQRFNLNAIVAGSEGTLCFVTRAKLKLTPVPRHKKLVAVRYADFDAALRAANVLVASNPGAIETIDDTIVSIAREDAIWHTVSHLVQGAGEPPLAAINLVEFESHDPEVVEQKVTELTGVLDAERGTPGKATGYTIATSAADIGALWSLRKKGVGLLGAAKGVRRPIPFVEDTAVPPENLADYIREFRALLDRHGLTYGMFGHVDVGCLHVRPALNMRDVEDERLLRTLSDEVVALVKKYGGVLWGEHGKGYRSEYAPVFFGEELYRELRRVKQVFDPDNQLNPGKLATPLSSNEPLVSVDAVKRGSFDRRIGPQAQESYSATVNCNGNGACFDWNPDSVMCPSAKVTQDRIHSPKGRAGVMRDWLRQVSEAGYDATSPPEPARLEVLFRGRSDAPGDFSHEVYDAMNGCLACKACATQCPIKVDVPEFRSRFFEHYHTRYRRPLKDFFFAGLEKMIWVLAWFPRLVNWFLSSAWMGGLLRRVVGIVDSPLLSVTTLRQGLRSRHAPEYAPRRLAELPAEEKSRSVLLLQDAFTSFYESNVVLATYDVLTRLGYAVYVLPYRENGKALHVKGFLRSFRRVVERNTAFLAEAAATGIPLVGLEPAVTLTYRDEYLHVLGTKQPPFRVQLVQEWLAQELERRDGQVPKLAEGANFRLFGHCTERTAALQSQRQWRQIFERLGGRLDLVDVGCCGMCGAYGHELAHYDESRGIFAMSWAEALPKAPADRERVLATGHSCRSQVKRFGGFVPRHPLEALAAQAAPSSALPGAQNRSLHAAA
jgi:FAD/FMN-containing dehydrogenase/Fe-S oxidoreductase